MSGHGKLISREILPRGLTVHEIHMTTYVSMVICASCYVVLVRIIAVKMISITYNKKVLLAQEHSLRLFFKGYTVAKP